MEKLEILNKHILRFIFKDWNCDYDSLLERADTLSLVNKIISNMMTSSFNCINFTNYPEYLKELFQFRTSDYGLRGANVSSQNPKQLHMVLTQLEMLQRDIGTRFPILLGEPLL